MSVARERGLSLVWSLAVQQAASVGTPDRPLATVRTVIILGLFRALGESGGLGHILLQVPIKTLPCPPMIE